MARFNSIIEERWYISNKTHTSYVDTGKITPTERIKLLEFIKKEQDALNNVIPHKK